ncbi:MAG: hypothetical protein ACYC3X_11710 [Pirellulaceae bacterium]
MTQQRRTAKWTWKKLLARLGLLAMGLLLGLVAAEIGLRLIGVSYPLPYVPDPYCGSRLRPGMVAEFTAEGHAWVHINQEGYRDRPHAHRKPAQTFRIAVLGDSFAEALQVPQEETFWSVMERELQDTGTSAGQTVEVLNFGVSGFGTAQALEMLRHYVWQYEPDLVLLAFLTGNDISDNSKRLSPDAVRPYYLLRPPGLVLDQTFQQHPFYLDAQSDFSKLKVTWINRLRVLQVMRQWRAQSRQHSPQSGTTAEPGLSPIFAPPQDEAWKEAWEITEQLLVLMREEVRAHNAEFLVAVLSNSDQVHPDKQRREELQKQLGVADLWYADRRVEDFCRQEGIPVILLAPEMQRYAEQHQVYLHGFPNTELGSGHWNADGHALAGKLIAAEIRRRTSVRGQPDKESEREPNSPDF